jgi:hypothetical protein
VGGEAVKFTATTDTHVENFHQNGGTGAGLIFWECVRPRTLGTRVTNTMADGLHFANCLDWNASYHYAENTGDDGFASVNYLSGPDNNGGHGTHIAVRNSKARGIAIAESSDVTVGHFLIDGTEAAGVRVQQDSGFGRRTLYVPAPSMADVAKDY